MTDRMANALEVVAERGESLRTEWAFDWSASSQQAVCRLRLGLDAETLPVLVAMVGGASSGKSTVFNNLLGGHLASRIAAQVPSFRISQTESGGSTFVNCISHRSGNSAAAGGAGIRHQIGGVALRTFSLLS